MSLDPQRGPETTLGDEGVEAFWEWISFDCLKSVLHLGQKLKYSPPLDASFLFKHSISYPKNSCVSISCIDDLISFYHTSFDRL